MWQWKADVSFGYVDPQTPGQNSQLVYGHFIGSPDEYFRMPPRVRQASRWKEDWDELELLVSLRLPLLVS